MSVQRWVFHEPVANLTYTVAMNPSEASGPERAKTIGYSVSAGPGGATLIYEGREPPAEMSFSGSILAQGHYEALEAWYLLAAPITITDDLGRVIPCYIKSFKPKRVRSALYPWKHTFDMAVIVMGAITITELDGGSSSSSSTSEVDGGVP